MNSIQSDSDDDLRHLYASVTLACVSGIGPRLRQLLLERFGSPEAVLAARPEELRSVARIGPKISEEILAANVDSTAEEVIALCCRHSVSICLEGSSDYPSLLREYAILQEFFLFVEQSNRATHLPLPLLVLDTPPPTVSRSLSNSLEILLAARLHDHQRQLAESMRRPTAEPFLPADERSPCLEAEC